MFISHPRRINKIETLAPLKLNGTEIKRVREARSLGVLVDENLSWKEHFKSLKGKVTSGSGGLAHRPTGPWPVGPPQNLAKRPPYLLK